MPYSVEAARANMAGAAILEALGISTENVRAFTMRFRVGEFPKLEVEYQRTDFANSEETSTQVGDAIRRFKLETKEDFV